MINSDYIRSYCLDKFKDNYRLSGNETELIIPSIFIPNDYKRHLSINLDTGLWRCFKTGNTGNFIKLYSILEKIPYRSSYQKFLFESFLKEQKEVEKKEIITNTEIEDTSIFEKLDTSKLYDELVMALASEFILKRGMEKFTFYVAKDGFYKNRLIIPFFSDSGKLFYFQGRSLLDSMQPKYLNCKSFKSSHILYPFNYDHYSPLFITEGVFDCLAIKSLGFNATTTLSCNTSKEQMEQLKQYRGELVCAFDNDTAGYEGIRKFMKMAYKYKISNIYYITPDPLFKDWNDYLIRFPEEMFADLSAKKFTSLNDLNLSLSKL